MWDQILPTLNFAIYSETVRAVAKVQLSLKCAKTESSSRLLNNMSNALVKIEQN